MDDDGRAPYTPEPDNNIVPNAPGLSTAHIWPDGPSARLKTHVGGSLAEISWPSTYPGRKKRVGGGRRQKITEFSSASRRRLFQLLNSINKTKITIPLLITLTYPGEFPTDTAIWKQNLATWRRRMQRKYGRIPMIWRLEFQRRGAPHFHLLVFIEANPSELYEFVSRSWYQSCGEITPEHLQAGTRVESLRSLRGMMAYAAKYMAKPEKFDAGAGIGRVWGVWFKDLLPVEVEETEIGCSDAIKIRRILRKFAGFRPRGAHIIYGLKAFVNYGTTNRLLAFYGYYRA